GGTVRFQCPDLHLPEALTTELGLTAQRLLGNQAVGAGGARVHFVVHKVIKLQHIHHTNGDLAIEGVSGAPVIKCDLATFIHASQLQHFLDLGLVGTIKYRRGHRHTVAQVMSELHDLIIIQLIKIFLATAYLVVDFIKKLAHFGYLLLLFQHQVDAFTQALRCRTEVSLQYLTHVHTRRYAERIQYDVDRVALFVVGHVFNRHDDGNDTLVTVAPCHLVARLDTTLDSQINLDDLQDSWCEVVALGQLALLVLETLVQFQAPLLELGFCTLQLLVELVLGHAQL